ncbi:MAG: methyltransferase domain-containing protein [Alphaproteobacteria bacterium]|nr:MAG: methyltransferase domain-containing protein [Alphaproteobacteria bacterium]
MVTEMDTDSAARGQVVRSAAEIYDAFFVQSLFGQFAAPCCIAAGVGPGSDVLDAACGTGVVAREAVRRTDGRGSVTGLDINPAMLEVARRTAGVRWVEGDIAAMPFEDGQFDAVICQFGLMFFPDRAGTLRELYRVTAPGGRMVVAVWDAVERFPGYADLVGLLRGMFGEAAAQAELAPFVLGDPQAFAACFADAGLEPAAMDTVAGEARFASIEDWMTTEIRGWTLADSIDDAGFARLLSAAEGALAHHVGADGRVGFAAPARIAVVRKPG